MKNRKNMYLIIFFALAYQLYNYRYDKIMENHDLDKKRMPTEISSQIEDLIPVDSSSIVGLKTVR